jgi:hypothetical protein
MDVNRGSATARFVQDMFFYPEWETAPEVNAQHPKPVRVTSIALIFTWTWGERRHDPSWTVTVRVRGARAKRDGTPYGSPEDLDVTYYARTQLAALLSKLVAENKPTMLPQVEYSSDVSKLVSE